MQDITKLVRQRLCRHLFADMVRFTMARPSNLKTLWLCGSNTAVLWFEKNFSDLPLSAANTICATWMQFFMLKYFGRSVNKQERRLLYKKMMLFNDGGRVIYIVYLVSENELTYLHQSLLPKLKGTTVFLSNPRMDPVVEAYRVSTRKWTSAAVAIGSAAAVGVAGMAARRSLTESKRQMTLLQSNADHTFQLNVPDDAQDKKVDFFASCLGQLHYTLPIAVCQQWAAGNTYKALECLLEMIESRRKSQKDTISKIINVVILFLRIPTMKEFICALISVCFIDTQPEFMLLLRKEQTEFKDFNLHEGLKKKLPTYSVPDFTSAELEQVSPFIKSLQEVQEILRNFDGFVSSVTGIIGPIEHIYLISLESIGKAYINLAYVYCQYYIAVTAAETLPVPLKWLVGCGNQSRYHSVISDTMFRLVEILPHFRENVEKSFWGTLHVAFSLFTNRLSYFNSCLACTKAAIDECRRKHIIEKYPVNGANVYDLLRANKAKLEPPVLEFLSIANTDVASAVKLLSEIKCDLEIPHADKEADLVTKFHLSALHLFGWWYTTTSPGYYDDAINGAQAAIENLQKYMQTEEKHRSFVTRMVLLRGILAIYKYELFGRSILSYMRTSWEKKDIDTVDEGVKNILKVVAYLEKNDFYDKSAFEVAVTTNRDFFNEKIRHAIIDNVGPVVSISIFNPRDPQAEKPDEPGRLVPVEQDNIEQKKLEGIPDLLSTPTSSSVTHEFAKWAHQVVYIKTYYGCVLRACPNDDSTYTGVKAISVEAAQQVPRDEVTWTVQFLEKLKVYTLTNCKHKDKYLGYDRNNSDGLLTLLESNYGFVSLFDGRYADSIHLQETKEPFRRAHASSYSTFWSGCGSAGDGVWVTLGSKTQYLTSDIFTIVASL